jgi:hypothetical protein
MGLAGQQIDVEHRRLFAAARPGIIQSGPVGVLDAAIMN